MKIQISKRELIVLFMLINLLLIGSIVYIKIKINNLSTYGIGGTVDKISLPYTNKSIRDLNLNSKAFIIYNPVGRIVVAGKNQNLRFAPASTVKIMTSTLIIEDLPLDKIINVSGILDVEGSKMKLFEGENI